MSGLVSLVGAGPGSLDLLTLKAAQRLKEADLVLYDGLVAPEVLQLAPSAHRFFVGKRAHQHCIEQEDIHALMIRAARRGQRVVRLKCGDPFVLGRGGEEALALAEAGVAFEVVPASGSQLGIPGPLRSRRVGVPICAGFDRARFGHPGGTDGTVHPKGNCHHLAGSRLEGIHAVGVDPPGFIGRGVALVRYVGRPGQRFLA
jgi:uroporphyrin-III C-methyltransferase/precorrin-2 dehydrogenase/sirohydrochlorin ferrochelatase